MWESPCKRPSHWNWSPSFALMLRLCVRLSHWHFDWSASAWCWQMSTRVSERSPVSLCLTPDPSSCRICIVLRCSPSWLWNCCISCRCSDRDIQDSQANSSCIRRSQDPQCRRDRCIVLPGGSVRTCMRDSYRQLDRSCSQPDIPDRNRSWCWFALSWLAVDSLRLERIHRRKRRVSLLNRSACLVDRRDNRCCWHIESSFGGTLSVRWENIRLNYLCSRDSVLIFIIWLAKLIRKI